MVSSSIRIFHRCNLCRRSAQSMCTRTFIFSRNTARRLSRNNFSDGGKVDARPRRNRSEIEPRMKCPRNPCTARVVRNACGETSTWRALDVRNLITFRRVYVARRRQRNIWIAIYLSWRSARPRRVLRRALLPPYNRLGRRAYAWRRTGRRRSVLNQTLRSNDIGLWRPLRVSRIMIGFVFIPLYLLFFFFF